jgi:hypothetical protein
MGSGRVIRLAGHIEHAGKQLKDRDFHLKTGLVQCSASDRRTNTWQHLGTHTAITVLCPSDAGEYEGRHPLVTG